MGFIDSIKTQWDNLPQWGKWAVPIAAIAAVGYGVYRSKQQSAYEVNMPASQSLDALGYGKVTDNQLLNNENGLLYGDIGALIDESVNKALGAIFVPENQTDITTFAPETSDKINGQQILNSGAITEGNSIAAQVPKEVLYPIAPVLGYGGINYNTATTEQKKAVEAQAKLITTSPAYVQSETARTLDVIQNRTAAGLDTGSQVKYLDTLISASGKSALVSGSPITAESNPLGIGGINYNTATTAEKKAIEQNAQRLKTDPAYVQSEIQRTQTVIANRKKAGLDTTAQDKYLSTLTGKK